MKVRYLMAFLLVASTWCDLRAELPTELKATAENFDRAMKTYEANVAAIVKADRDAYLRILNLVRKREEGAKRLKAVAAIDMEIKAVDANQLSEATPVDLPSDVSRYRTRYVTAPARAEKAVESGRRHTRQQYLKWLDGMAQSARRGNSAELEAAVAREGTRVRGDAGETKPEDKPPVAVNDGRRAKCWKNVHRIGVASLIYAVENDVYPNGIAELVKAGEFDKAPVSPYATDKTSSSYELTMPGIPGGFTRNATRTIVVRCKVAGPDGKVSAGFADGHVESVPADALAIAYKTAKSTPRTWSDRSGKFSIEATLSEFVASGVKLSKTGGEIISIPYARLSRADVDYLRTLNVYAPK